MGRYQVTCIVKRGDHYNPHERIEAIGQQGSWMMSEDSAIQRIESRSDSFFVSVQSRSAEVEVAVHRGRKYLKTHLDNYAPNNLLNLPECKGCKTIG